MIKNANFIQPNKFNQHMTFWKTKEPSRTIPSSTRKSPVTDQPATVPEHEVKEIQRLLSWEALALQARSNHVGHARRRAKDQRNEDFLGPGRLSFARKSLLSVSLILHDVVDLAQMMAPSCCVFRFVWRAGAWNSAHCSPADFGRRPPTDATREWASQILARKKQAHGSHPGTIGNDAFRDWKAIQILLGSNWCGWTFRESRTQDTHYRVQRSRNGMELPKQLTISTQKKQQRWHDLSPPSQQQMRAWTALALFRHRTKSQKMRRDNTHPTPTKCTPFSHYPFDVPRVLAVSQRLWRRWVPGSTSNNRGMTVENPSHHQDYCRDLCSEDRARTDANDEVLAGWRNMYRASYQRQFASSTVLDCERRRDLQPVNLHMSEKTIENVNLDRFLWFHAAGFSEALHSYFHFFLVLDVSVYLLTSNTESCDEVSAGVVVWAGRYRRRWRRSRWRSCAGCLSRSQSCRSTWRGRTGKRRWSAGRGKRRSRATQRETLIMDGMRMKVTNAWTALSQCGCDVSVTKTRHLTACRRAQTSRMLCLCLLVYVMYFRVTVVIVHIGLEGVLVVMYFCVAILFVNCCIRRYSLYRLRRNSLINQEPQVVHSSIHCNQFSCHFWCDVISDRWSSGMYTHDPHRVSPRKGGSFFKKHNFDE